MKLADYLTHADLSPEEFASRISVTTKAVEHWSEGRRIPRARFMQRIADATNGEVTANDFFIAEQPREAAQ